ncbi:tryptophan aminotransferase-related protein [Salix suchowensis]|nr:tryptophan aminotransferase-related protein [Salix suchowensis]
MDRYQREKGSDEISLKAMGRAINKTVMIAELIKRRIADLHQNTSIGSTDITDTWEPLEEGLLPLETTRHVSVITITLSKKELDTSSAGYQSPIPADQVKPLTEYDHEGEGGSPRRHGRGHGSRGMARGRGDTSLWKNNSDAGTEIIEFVTSPNNPDGQLNKAVLHGSNVKTIHDHAYYWPHFTAIPAPADGDVMIFTLSKLTGHAGSRFGRGHLPENVTYLALNTMGVSRDSQLRSLKLLKAVLAGGGRDIFEFGHETMKKRWEKLNKVISMSKRFSLQKTCPQVLHLLPENQWTYGWLKCEKEEDKHCSAVLQAAANIIGREGSLFYAEDRYVRLSLIKSQDDFDLLLNKLNELVSGEEGPKNM